MGIPVLIFAMFAPETRTITVAIMAVFILMGIIGAFLIYRLAIDLEEPWPWLYVLCAFIPYVSTATLLIMNARATGALKGKGIGIGLMGASKRDLQDLHK